MKDKGEDEDTTGEDEDTVGGGWEDVERRGNEGEEVHLWL